ncbi:MAG TPA: hypothetical protein VMY38_03325 [Gemmatimonadaceae bacterium]|nr:hypothetical protein [Gemmatimonadaceae bacterium]
MPTSYVVPPADTAHSDHVSFLSLINFVLRNALILGASGLAFAILVAIPAVTAAPTYSVTTKFATESEPVGRLFGFSLPGNGGGRGPEFYIELIKSPEILAPLVESSYEVEPGKPRKTLIEHFAPGVRPASEAKVRAMSAASSRISTKVSPTTSSIILRVTAENPILATQMAEAVLVQIDRFNSTTRKLQTTAERRFAEQRLAEISVEVRQAEERLRYFRERNRDISLSPALNLERERLEEEVSTRRGLYSSVLQTYERAKMDEVRDSPLVTVIGRPVPPSQPDARGMARSFVLGFFLGLLVGGILVAWTEYLDRVRQRGSPEFAEFDRLGQTMSRAIRRPLEKMFPRLKGMGT